MVSELFQVNEIKDSERGSLAVLESNLTLPFEFNRIFYIYGTKDGVRRGAHAHHKTRQALIAVSGHCKVSLDNLERQTEVLLDAPSKVLILEPNDWHEMYDFSSDCVLLVIASHLYDPQDYIRSYDEFLKVYKS